ncbi:MAG: hypothetical protein RIT04_200 [Candidatus Parcubacteria bacterium]|jgi:hypothetical protein
MPRAKTTKKSATKSVVEPRDEEMDETKTKNGPIDIPEEDDKGVDPETISIDEALAEEEEGEDDAMLDKEEIDPFGDKWEE